MKIFISWSGSLSKKVAISLKEILPDCIQHVEAYVSSEDIRKGGRWSLDIAKQLKETQYGIICLTYENLNEPWILFEAGALSKYLDEALVCTLLIGNLSITDIQGPLSQFQHTVAKKDDVKKLFNSINEKSGDRKLEQERVNRLFDNFWPRLEKDISDAINSRPSDIITEKKRSDTELIKEVLELSRNNSKSLADMAHLNAYIPQDQLINQLEKKLENIIGKEINKQVYKSQQRRPDLSTYFAQQWKFIEKTFKNRFAKHDICRRIVEKYVPQKSKILLDSGSTIDLVTYELLGIQKDKITVYSNNVFAAMHLVGTDKIEFRLLNGRFSERFAAIYSEETLNYIKNIEVDLYIMATTAFRFDDGISVDNEDKENRDFKNAMLSAFINAKNSKLIIAVDPSKFTEPLDKHQTVISPKEWKNILKEYTSRIVIVTYPMPPDIDSRKEVEFEEEVKRFRDEGIVVDIGSETPITMQFS